MDLPYPEFMECPAVFLCFVSRIGVYSHVEKCGIRRRQRVGLEKIIVLVESVKAPVSQICARTLAFLFQNVFAYVVCLCVYQIGSFAMGGAFGAGTAVGIALALVLVVLLVRPDPYKNSKVYSKRSVQAA